MRVQLGEPQRETPAPRMADDRSAGHADGVKEAANGASDVIGTGGKGRLNDLRQALSWWIKRVDRMALRENRNHGLEIEPPTAAARDEQKRRAVSGSRVMEPGHRRVDKPLAGHDCLLIASRTQRCLDGRRQSMICPHVALAAAPVIALA
jgi:hypothetical protein